MCTGFGAGGGGGGGGGGRGGGYSFNEDQAQKIFENLFGGGLGGFGSSGMGGGGMGGGPRVRVFSSGAGGPGGGGGGGGFGKRHYPCRCLLASTWFRTIPIGGGCLIPSERTSEPNLHCVQSLCEQRPGRGRGFKPLHPTCFYWSACL